MSASNETTASRKISGVTSVASGLSADEVSRLMRRRGEESRWWWLVPTIYIIVLLLPIYWLVNMSFKTNAEIVNSLTLYPHNPTIANYVTIFTEKAWYSGYINSITYVVINMVISVAAALPAAYAFSRYRFLGDKHLSSGC